MPERFKKDLRRRSAKLFNQARMCNKLRLSKMKYVGVLGRYRVGVYGRFNVGVYGRCCVGVYGR